MQHSCAARQCQCGRCSTPCCNVRTGTQPSTAVRHFSQPRQRPQFAGRSSQTARRSDRCCNEANRCKVIDMMAQRWPTSYPDPRDAVPVLVGAAEAGRVNDRGEVTLATDEAATLRQAGYTAILGAGRWPAPNIPLDLLRPHASLAPLALFWYGPGALDPPPPPARPRRGDIEIAPRENMTPPEAVEITPPDRLDVKWHLAAVLDQADHRRLLAGLMRRPDGPVARRELQQALHRLPAVRFNAALDALVETGLVAREEQQLALSGDVRRLLLEAGIGVSRAAA